MSGTPPEERRRASNLLLAGGLGFCSGLPLALSGSTLQAWLTVEGVDLKTIGALSLVGWPYLLKFLWAPALDRWSAARLGRRRGWLLASQASLALVLAVLAAAAPIGHLNSLLLLAFAVAFLSATQDVAYDAWRTEALPPALRGLGTGYSIAGYRAAMFTSGAGALYVADQFGFPAAYGLMAILMLAACGVTLLAPEPTVCEESELRGPAALLAPLRELASRPGIAVMLALVVLYKLGDQFAAAMTQAFLLRGLGFSLSEVATAYKALGLAAALAGGVVGGAAMMHLRLPQALLWFGLLQLLTNTGFLALALLPKSLATMMLAVGLENFCGAMGTCAHVALLMALCNTRHTATQFALLTALASVGRVLLGPFAGAMAEAGWLVFFGVSCVLAVPALLLLRPASRQLHLAGAAG